MVLQKIIILLDLFWFKKNKSHFCMEFFLNSQALILKIGSRICIPKLAHRSNFLTNNVSFLFDLFLYNNLYEIKEVDECESINDNITEKNHPSKNCIPTETIWNTSQTELYTVTYVDISHIGLSAVTQKSKGNALDICEYQIQPGKFSSIFLCQMVSRD